MTRLRLSVLLLLALSLPTVRAQAQYPVLSSLDPVGIEAGNPSFTLTVNGSNFLSTSVVYWNKVALPTSYVSSTRLQATVPASYVANQGSAAVNVGNGSAYSAYVTFTIYAPVTPTVTFLSPSGIMAGSASFTLGVNGTGFVSGTQVLWNGSALPTVFSSSNYVAVNSVSSSLVAVPGTAAISVRKPNGLTSNSMTFTITPHFPVLSSISPTSVTAGSPTFTMTLNGAYFDVTAMAYFGYTYPGYPCGQMGSASMTTTYISANQLRATVPSSLVATAGSYCISVFQNPAARSEWLPFTVLAVGTPTITYVTPTTVPTCSADTQITLIGTGFVQGAVARWNTSNLSTTFVSSTQLTATIPAAYLTTAGTASITVLNPTGQVSNPVGLSVIAASPPTLTSITPSSAAPGSPGFTLTVSGSGFTQGMTVRWSQMALATTFVSATQLTAAVPASQLALPGTFYITVANACVQSNALPFTVSGPPLTVTGIDPGSATACGPDQLITVTGTGFQQGAVVQWNGVALSTTFVNSNQLTATVSSSLLVAGTAVITVRNPNGQTSNAVNFTVTAAPAPTLFSINPNSAGQGSSGFTLTVTGTGFTQGMTVRWSGTALPTNFISSTQLTATVQAGLLATAGVFNITVGNNCVQSNALPFTVTGGPHISAISPDSAASCSAALLMMVAGTGFQQGAIVRWNTSQLATTFGSGTQLAATVPADLLTNPGNANITVVNPDGQVSNGVIFTVNPLSPITVLEPSSKPAGSPDFTLTVRGSGFQQGMRVLWGGVSLATTFVSATQLNGFVPANLLTTPGTVNVAVSSPCGSTSNTLPFTITVPPMTITSVSPNSVAAGSDDITIVVTGTGFIASTFVRWNGTPLATTFNSATQLTAQVPRNLLATPVTASISVAVPSGQASNDLPFTVTSAGLSIISISPTSIPAGAGSFSLTVNGAGFVGGSKVQWSSTALATTFGGASQLSATVPANLLTAPGMVVITVANPGGVTSNGLAFTIEGAQPPVISSLHPYSTTAGAAAFTLTVTGTGFVNGTQVRWAGTGLATTFVNSTQLTGAVAADLVATPGVVAVTVVLPSGVSSGPASFTVNAPPLPQVILGGLPASCTTAQQHQPQITLASAYQHSLTGEVTLTYTPASGLTAAGDFMQNYKQVQFATGGMQYTFSIQAGTTQFQPPMIQTGTVAGKVTATITDLRVGTVTVTPPSVPVQTVEVVAGAPKINSLQIVRTSTGFEVRIVGDSSIREVTELAATFQAAAGANLLTTSLTVPVSSAFSDYFTSAASSQYGSTYQLVLPFTIDGQQNAVSSATITLRNRIGTSQSASAGF